MRIMIVGYSGSGKSTLAKALSAHYSIPVLHLDTVHHMPGWQERDRDSECRIVEDFLNANESWVIDGNYQKICHERRLESADMIIMLLFGRLTCFYRAYRRYKTYKGKSRPDMTEGCSEKFDRTFRRWLLIDGRKKERRQRFDDIRKKYPERVTVIRNQRALDKFVSSLGIKE